MMTALSFLKPRGANNAASLYRRMASFFYEVLLLWGILILSGIVGGLFVFFNNQYREIFIQFFTFVIFGFYFVWFWSVRGQTLAMRTWKIRLVTVDGKNPSVARSIARYMACYFWFGVTALVVHLNGWAGKESLIAFSVSLLVYALMALFHPERKFWHDAICRTQIINVGK